MTSSPLYPRETLDPGRRTGLILCGMGGPDGPDAVRPFLRNLFRDPRIIPIPRLLAPLLGGLIAWRRAPAVRARYAMIGHGGGSPQLETTERQAADLAARLGAAGCDVLPGAAMRYWHPFSDETVARLRDAGARQYLVVPTYPQYSDATNGSTLAAVCDAAARLAPDAPLHVLAEWHRLPGYAAALAAPVSARLRVWADAGAEPRECAVLFVAHSLPRRFIDAGDPYETQTRATVADVHALVRRALEDHGALEWLDRAPGGQHPLLAFQSRVGPIEWLGPEVVAETRRLGAAGCRRLHVQPVSFTCEHIETLHELDIELVEDAHAAGIVEFSRGAALNLDPVWLGGLSTLLRDTAFGPREDARV